MKLDLLEYAQQLETKHDDEDKTWLKCLVRKKWYRIQPEELVRQALIVYLKKVGFSTNLMQVERKVGQTKDRLDLLILDKETNPYLLVEIKAPGFDLKPAVQQLARYNRYWKAPFTLAVNGQEAICCKLDFNAKTLEVIEKIPEVY